MSHKIIFENWRKFVKLNEQGLDPVTGQPLTIGGQAAQAAGEPPFNKKGQDQDPTIGQQLAVKAGQGVLRGAGVDCDGIKLHDLYSAYREKVFQPFFDAIGGAGDGGTYAPVELFTAQIEYAFSACDTTGADYHGLQPTVDSEEKNTNISSYNPGNGEPASIVVNYLGQQATWEGVGRALTKAVSYAETKGHSPFVNKEGHPVGSIMGG